MRIYWKALIFYGFVFWLLLCITDFLGITNIHKYSKDFDDLYEKPEIVRKIEENVEPQNKVEYKGVRFGWSLVVWNTLTFIFSIIVCTIGQTIGWMIWSIYRFYKNKLSYSQLKIASSQYIRAVSTLSKIPVMVKTITRSSDSNLYKGDAKMKINTEKSCPNLILRRTGSNLSSITDIPTKTTRTIFTNDLSLYDKSHSKGPQMETCCEALREELNRIQSASMKEHAILSRKLDAITKEKREIVKQLATAQKENRAAKQQLEELLQEKSSLIKKLENATKEFKCNTKTKKVALAKLEEVTNNVEELRQQLEQVTRDKEILEKKLRLLEIEYNKLHERYMASQQRIFSSSNHNNTNEHFPERDENNDKMKNNFSDTANFSDSQNILLPLQQTANVLASVSQTELDMKKIQEKIRQLEKNLENLNMSTSELERSTSVQQLESDASLSAIDGTSDSQIRVDAGQDSATTMSGFSSNNSPRQRYSQKITELVGKNKNKFAKIQALAVQMQEKARYFENIREKIESTEGVNDTETSDSDKREPKRLVSSSVAFKKFLKSLNKLDAAKHQIPSGSEIYF